MSATTQGDSGPALSLAAALQSERAVLYRAALALTRGADNAQDLVQETLLRALGEPPACSSQAMLRGWLLTTLRNLFLDGCRVTLRRRFVPLSEEMTTPHDDVSDTESMWRLVDDETLATCVAAMDPQLREVYLMRAQRGMTMKQIAEQLGVPPATAGTRLFRARRRLKLALEQRLSPRSMAPCHRACPRDGHRRVIQVSHPAHASLKTAADTSAPVHGPHVATPAQSRRSKRTSLQSRATFVHAFRVRCRALDMGLIRHHETGTFCALDGEHIVGRSPRAGLQLDCSYVSAQHASLRWRPDGWHLKDLGSRNGTFIGDQLIKPGQSLKLARGARITFGKGTETWELVDDSAPQAALVALPELSKPVLVQGQILALPTAECPTATIFSRVDGCWILEQRDSSSPLVNGQEFEIAGQRWRFFCPSSAGQTATADLGASQGLAGARVVFRVSLDEEHVEVVASRGPELMDIGSREHNYLLLFLARKRLEDVAAGIAQGSCGWVYQEEVLSALAVSAERLNVDVYRIRGQFVKAVGRDGGSIVERRPKTKQLRIGTPLVSIERI